MTWWWIIILLYADSRPHCNYKLIVESVDLLLNYRGSCTQKLFFLLVTQEDN